MVSGREKAEFSEGSTKVYIVTSEGFREGYASLEGAELLMYHYEDSRIDNIDIFDDRVIGTFTVPMKQNVIDDQEQIGFYMTGEELIFIDDSDIVYSVMERLEKRQRHTMCDTAHVFIRIMEMLISDDMMFLQKYGMILNRLEDSLEESRVPADFPRTVARKKKELREITGYYRELGYIADELDDSVLFGEDAARRLNSFSNKLAKLLAEAADLHETAQQIQDIYQTQINIRQNRTMTLLTVLSAFFMPLTLIAGWYGMNIYMPEADMRYSYLLIIGISLAVILIEILIFRRGKWFK